MEDDCAARGAARGGAFPMTETVPGDGETALSDPSAGTATASSGESAATEEGATAEGATAEAPSSAPAADCEDDAAIAARLQVEEGDRRMAERLYAAEAAEALSGDPYRARPMRRAVSMQQRVSAPVHQCRICGRFVLRPLGTPDHAAKGFRCANCAGWWGCEGSNTCRPRATPAGTTGSGGATTSWLCCDQSGDDDDSPSPPPPPPPSGSAAAEPETPEDGDAGDGGGDAAAPASIELSPPQTAD